MTTTTIQAGYKMTEIGVIPEDWEVKNFKEVSKVNQGLQIAIEKRFKYQVPNSKKYITIQYLNDAKEVEWIDSYSNSVCCSEDDILMTRTGNTGIVITNVSGVFHNNFFKIIFDQKILNRQYLIYYLKFPRTQKTILVKAGTSTIPDLNHNDFYSICIPVPPKHEQQAIATILSDTDELIRSLSALIAKKRQIKEGAMQELLTGKKRLAGYSGEWEVKKLGEIADYRNGKSFENSISKNGSYNLITLNSIDIKGKLKKEHLKVDINDNSLSKGDLIMILSDVAHGNFLGLTDVIPEDNKYVLNQRIGALKNLKNVISRFLSIYINQNQKYFKMSGKGSSQQNLGKNDILNFEIRIPPFEEQQAIAEILSDMDSEITALEQKREKYRLIKQGVMQQLLTGKIRLI
jgi:type I restriction enzyme S subunit